MTPERPAIHSVDTEITIQALQAHIEQLQYDATHDALTGLPNRRYFDTALSEYIAAEDRGSGNVGMIFLDLDDFKAVNDSKGHKFGDDLLRRVADLLVGHVRAHHIDVPTEKRKDAISDIVFARFAGDEFAILVAGVNSLQLASVRDRLNSVLMAARINASMGAVLHQPGQSAEDFYADADAAMYKVKIAKRNQLEAAKWHAVNDRWRALLNL